MGRGNTNNNNNLSNSGFNRTSAQQQTQQLTWDNTQNSASNWNSQGQQQQIPWTQFPLSNGGAGQPPNAWTLPQQQQVKIFFKYTEFIK